MFAIYESTDAKYKACFRSRYLNLKDLHNPRLKIRLINSEISPSEFCEMTSQQMASEERKAEDAAINETNLMNAQAASETGAETDMFKCGKCHKRRTRFHQMQTRSADEPMTTFVTCLECGNKWKFS